MSEFNTSDFLNPMVSQTWTNGRHMVRCAKVIAETHDVTTFTFNMNHPVLFLFKPGQFVTLELEINGERVMRSYTISSSPSIPYSFSITVKRVPGGLVSNWLHDNLKSGDQLAIHGPVGQFNCMDFPAEKVLLLSGGVGITPVMSMARWWFDTDSEVDYVFAHSARTPKDIIYRHELSYMSSRIDNFKSHLICEKTEIGQAWDGYRGYLNIHMLNLIAPDFREREVFCCGPTPYMSAVKSMLESNGFDMSHYHEESFGATPVADVAQAEKHAEMAEIQDQQPKDLVSLRFADSDQVIEVDRGSNINEAAAEAGVNISKACGIGICGACRVKVISGEFEMLQGGGISDEEIAEGYILTCCSSIQSDLVIES
ncbi:hybrid-cluster NAD(P)-dependent oxidoreductase [Marinomonas sp. 15G1-11]|uniref:Hybrid-cluster NAD(P)-dependent oxidoreductase n=1 Tax=Marinomonas phaeophyticola TaxID=3004091 RepID=A0ABT4JWX7_9GAMM|nr:hybrid-cluster NAD(P)-dependent oxidoreductase [Marinomonas sp. 15G1-11]MCZ2722582.1 hybrid-cluster NAD(P)-dependent oxidoreductase [Marinomonas sp. 15G1-11]